MQEFFGGAIRNGTSFLAAPVVRIEPRWYYNLENRVSKGKIIKNNSANFLTIGVNYHPDSFVISNTKAVNVVSQIAFIPKWGIKRTIGNHFTYETGIRIGFSRILDNSYIKKNEVALDLHLRIGYTL